MRQATHRGCPLAADLGTESPAGLVISVSEAAACPPRLDGAPAPCVNELSPMGNLGH